MCQMGKGGREVAGSNFIPSFRSLLWWSQVALKDSKLEEWTSECCCSFEVNDANLGI